jgi:hypothetical protein
VNALAWRREARSTGGLSKPAYASSLDWVKACEDYERHITRKLHRENGPIKVLRAILTYLAAGTCVVDTRAISTIARDVGVTPRWVRCCLAELEAGGLVARLFKLGWRGEGQRGWDTTAYVVPDLLLLIPGLARPRRAAALLLLRAPLLRAELRAWLLRHRPELAEEVDNLVGGGTADPHSEYDNRKYRSDIASKETTYVVSNTIGSESPLPPSAPEFSTPERSGGAVAPSPQDPEARPWGRLTSTRPIPPRAPDPSKGGLTRGGWPHGRFRSSGAETRAKVGWQKTKAKREHEQTAGVPPGRKERHRGKARAVLLELEAIRREKRERGEGGP